METYFNMDRKSLSLLSMIGAWAALSGDYPYPSNYKPSPLPDISPDADQVAKQKNDQNRKQAKRKKTGKRK
mgnify:FL=1